MGSGTSFDSAVAEFALSYANQVDSDWRRFVEAIKSGTLEARSR